MIRPVTEGDKLRMLNFRDLCLRTGGLSTYVAELFDALANDDLGAAQRAGAAYVIDYHAVRREQARAVKRLREIMDQRPVEVAE